jgi:hypothetical protein
LQCETQVRERESVTLREKVTRRRISAESMDLGLPADGGY